MQAILFVLSIVVFAFGVLLIYQLLKPLVLDKIRINKWIILAAALIEFIVPSIIWPTMPNIFVKYIVPGVFVILFLWFLDLSGYIKKNQQRVASYKKNKNKSNVVIKPKAKPNRVKK
ncbi:hypothetical protein [Clostridium tunisiense]|uniref:hypothetical protein n=1 Tax=Clostridium tunisiense TaxID=219748 RepID=UPI0002EC1D28|nr:hypothetical protein [Clostridium tunisiense]